MHFGDVYEQGSSFSLAVPRDDGFEHSNRNVDSYDENYIVYLAGGGKKYVVLSSTVTWSDVPR